mgnify:CR=1 FL=1
MHFFLHLHYPLFESLFNLALRLLALLPALLHLRPHLLDLLTQMLIVRLHLLRQLLLLLRLSLYLTHLSPQSGHLLLALCLYAVNLGIKFVYIHLT